MSLRHRKEAEAEKKRGFKHRLQKNIVSGLVVLVPLVITGVVINFIFDLVAGLLLPALTFLYDRLFYDKFPEYLLAPVAVLVVLLIIIMVGATATHVVVRRAVGYGEKALENIPLAGSVYISAKKIMDLFLLSHQTPFQEVVLIDYPHPGIKIVGWVSGRITGLDGRAYFKVFVPTSPNPASGFLQLVPCESAEVLDMSIEDSVKYVMSAGMLAPDALRARREGESSETTLPEQRLG